MRRHRCEGGDTARLGVSGKAEVQLKVQEFRVQTSSESRGMKKGPSERRYCPVANLQFLPSFLSEHRALVCSIVFNT